MINSTAIRLLIVTVMFSRKWTFGNIVKENSVLTSHGCTTNDFVGGANCTLWCTFNGTDYNDYIWSYYTTDRSTSYVFDDQYTTHDYDEVTNNHNITLTLSEYNSGNYECQFLVTEDAVENETYYVFQITGTDGAKLNAFCSNDSDCLALNAVCNEDGKRCQCVGNFYVPFNDYSDTPACLPPADFNTPCQSDNQCLAVTSISECDDGYCQCEVNFTFDNGQCMNSYYVKVSLSAGALAGIAIGCLVGVAIICGIIYYVVRGRRVNKNSSSVNYTKSSLSSPLDGQ